MRVGDEHGIERSGLQMRGQHVLRLHARAALKQAEVHEHPRAAGFDEIGGPGDFAGGAMHGDFDGMFGGSWTRFHKTSEMAPAMAP